MREFENGAALVIGGSGGIGQAICHCLAKHGCPVALTYHNNKDKANALAAEIENQGVAVSTHSLDLADQQAVASVFKAAKERHAGLHSIVLAAGSKIEQPYISKLEAKDWHEVIDADVNGAFHVVREAIPLLREAGGGSIVYISSAGLKRFPPGDVLSVAPKGAIEALLRGVAREEGRNNIRANSIAVGIAETGMFPELVAKGELDEAYLNAAKKNIALRRFGQPEEIAEAAVFLASKRSSYITGQTLMLDGGYSV